ncbi:condensation domain-containing protein [Streptomyces sp. 5-6(2022)]|uniref:condensation domain-containing protein n=1 Tax=Streptomyces sp. 5-6(2022) TaxID=2936510 RepID=UPI0023B9A884|nr:condensation domain-containing protein [Streptomyces sp. 5-6(2022)]
MSPAENTPYPGTAEDSGTLLFPTSYAQQRMWFFHRLERGNPYYNIPLALRLTGVVDPGALRSALDSVVARHEILRTTFVEQDGEPLQRVSARGTAALETVGLPADQEQEWAQEWIARPFDLATGPLFRAALLTTAPDRHLLLLCLHHIVTDGWSLNILTRELAAYYREYLTGRPAALAPLPIQYADFAEWQRDRLGGGELDRGLAHWREQLRGELPVLRMPTDRPRPETQSFRGARVDFALPDDVTAGLREVGRSCGATLFMTLFSGVAALLHRYTGQDDILIGSPIAGRDQADTEPLLGLFVNTLTLRGDLSGEPTFTELLARTRRMCAGAYSHQDVPLDKLVEALQPERDPGRNPLFQTMFALQNPPRMEFSLPGAELRAEAMPRESTRFDLEFHLWEDGSRLHGAVVYSTDLFDRATVTRLTGHLCRLLAEVVRAPQVPVADLPMQDEDRPAGAAAGTRNEHATVPGAFAAQASRTPGAVAVTTSAGSLDYDRLRRRVDELTRWLRARGIAHGQRVGLHMRPGTDSVVSTLALLTLGAVCVPMDPGLPAAPALRWIAATGVGVLLTDRPSALPKPMPDTVDAIDMTTVDLPGTGRTDRSSLPSPGTGPRGADPAYVVRGGDGPVVLRHADLCDTLDWLQERFGLGPDDTVLHHTTDALPSAVHALLWPLLHGAAVCPAHLTDLARLGEAVEAHAVTLAFLAPTALGALVAHGEDTTRTGAPETGPGTPDRAGPGRLRLVLTDGGRLTARLTDRFHAACGAALHRLWSLPESGGYIAALHCRPGQRDADLGAGRAGNRPVTVADDRGRALPDGAPGRLHTRPPGHSAPRPTTRHGRWLADGRLAVSDDEPHRVRIDGHETGPAEVENALLTDDSLSACAVLPRITTDGVEELVAYVVPAGAFSVSRLRERAAALLPAPLVPRVCVTVTTLPLNRHGHLDAGALTALPVMDDDLVGRWERELPGAAVITEEDTGREAEERVHVGELGAAPEPEGPAQESGPDPAHPAGLPARPAIAAGPPAPEPGVRTLPEALHRAAAADRGGMVLIGHDGTRRDVSYAELATEAARVRCGLRGLGLVPGDRAILQCPDNHDYLTAFWACLLGGFIPVPLAPSPSYEEDNTQVDRLESAWELLGRPLVLADAVTARGLRRVAARRGWGGAPRLGVLDELRGHEPDGSPHTPDPDDIALLLLTSGSTGRPKAVPLRHRNVLARCAATSVANGFGPDEVTFNWMPLDHVGGVVMFHVRDVYLGCAQIHAPTSWVLEEPLRWLEAADRHRVTLTWAPNFAFGLVNDRLAQGGGHGWDLSCLRFIQNAGEAIMPRVARRFLQALRPLGLPETAMRPSWGMSETSSAVTYSDTFTLATTSDTDPFTEVGRPLPGTVVRIADDSGETAQEGVPGRLLIKGPTVISGYEGNEEENRASFTVDGWFETGDLGVVRDGVLTITGRAKDVLIVNGVNYYCHEIESVVEELDSVENSWTAACAVRDADATTDGLALFFHLRSGADTADTIREIRGLLVDRVGINPRHVLPVERRDIPKTEIGKIQRARLRERFQSGGFDALVAEVDLLLGNERTLPNWFHERVWRAARPMPGPAADPGTAVLVLSDEDGLADRLTAELTASGRPWARADRGEEYGRTGECRYRIRPERAEDHGRLLDALTADGLVVGEIVDLTTYGPPGTHGSHGAVPADTAALVHLLQALTARRADDRRVTLRVVGRHTQQVVPADVLDCDRAARLALLASLAQEVPWLRCSHLDLPEAPPDQQITHVLSELAARPGETEAAVRDGKRLVPRLAVPRAQGPAPAVPFRRGGLYVVSGGLGGIGVEICVHLLDAYDARLLVLGRTPLPPEAEWEARIATGDDTGRRLEAYRALRARGERVLYATADVCREDEVRAALRRAEDRWSVAPSGVIHLAGTLRRRAFLEQTVDELADVMAPKATGARVLLDCLGEAADPVFIAFSSVNGSLGGAMVSAYSAGNAHLDAFVRNRFRDRGGRFHSLAWSMWDGTGMSRDQGFADPGRARGFRAIGRSEGTRSFVHALRQNRPHLFIGLDPAKPWIRGRLDAPVRPVERLTAYTEAGCGSAPDAPATLPDRYGVPAPCRRVELDELPRTATGTVDRDALRDAGRPRDEADVAGPTQQLIARIWCEVLGLDRVGPRENFFDLGGHSLQLSRVHGLLEAALEREFSMVNLFRHPTVGALSDFLDGATGTAAGVSPEPSRHKGQERARRRQSAAARGRHRRG